MKALTEHQVMSATAINIALRSEIVVWIIGKGLDKILVCFVFPYRGQDFL
jgi:hypothetical protein